MESVEVDQPHPDEVRPDEELAEEVVAAVPATREGPLYRRPDHDQRPLVAQPAVAMRARRHLSMITLGLVFALVGVVGIVGSSVAILRLTDAGRLWPAAGNAAAVVAALVALRQWRLWTLALREWEGIQDVGLGNWMNVSAAGVWLSLGAAIIAPIAAHYVVLDSTPSDTSWWLAIVGACGVILGMAFAGVHSLHPRGPRGVPPHIRRNHHREDERVSGVRASD